MPRILRTPAAEADMWEILLHVARDSEDAAFRLIDSIDERFELLARFPGPGRNAPNWLRNFEAFLSGII